MTKSNKSIFQQREDNLKKWASFWRSNPHRFVYEYLGIKLFMFQKILLYMMNYTPSFMFIAARGLGKSFLVAIYVVVRCILYPGTKIVLASGVKNQARLIISEKIVDLISKSPILEYEIKDVKTGVNNPEVIFFNGSKISAVASNNNTRGVRGNVLVADEFRMIDYKIIKDVLKPIINVDRTPTFKLNDEEKYEDYKEKNIEIYISSAWYKSHWSWDLFKEFYNNMLRNVKDAFVATLPYQVSILHGLLDPDRVNADMESDLFDPYVFQMEFEGLFVGETEKSFFKLDPINRNRTVTKTFIPPTNDEFVENSRLAKPKKLTNMQRKPGEIRIVGLDVALMASSTHENDTAAFTCMRMLPSGNNEYVRHVVYLETVLNGISTQDLALKLKRLFYDFEADYVAIDGRSSGLSVFDLCASVMQDDERDTEYEAWSAIDNKALQDRFKNNNGKPVVYAYFGNSKLNDDIARNLRASFASGKLKIPISHIQKHDDLVSSEDGRYKKLSVEEQQYELYSFQQSSALVSELILLEGVQGESAYVKIKEPSNGTKDRYSSLSYTNHRASEIEAQLRAKEEDSSLDEYVPTKIRDWRGRR